MQDTTSRLALRRAFRKNVDAVNDFEGTTPTRSVARPALVALVISGLGVLGAGGVALATASASTEQAKHSLVIDKNAADDSKAAPQDITLDANQKAAAQADADASADGDGDGSLRQFGQRGSTPNRNAARAAIQKHLINAKGAQREASLTDTNKSVTQAKAQAEAEEREKLMAHDIAKVKAEEKRIKEEKRKAAELLKRLREQAAKNAAAKKKQGSSPDQDAQEKGAQEKGSREQEFTPEDLQQISNGSVAMPLRSGTYSRGAYFGKTGSWARYHTGQDFPAATGVPVYAAGSGVVGASMSAAGWAGSKYVTIHHSNGGSTLYAHLSGRVVYPGQVVKAGQLIGYVGNEGRSFGSHLHFEYYPSGTTPGDVYSAADPMAWLRSQGLNA